MSLFARYIRASPEVLEWFVDDPIARSAYFELCGRAEWREPSKRLTKNGWLEVDIGQCCFGREELAERIGHTERRVRASIGRLESAGAIAIKTSKVGSIATIIGLKEKLLSEREKRPSERPSERPTDVQPASTTKILPDSHAPSVHVGSASLPEPPDPGHGGGGDRVQAPTPVRATSYNRRKEWWEAMNAAHDRLRKPTATRAAIMPNAPDLAKHPNETMLMACERFLRDGGYDDAAVDAKMRHVVLVAEAEAEGHGHLRYFKPAIIFDTTTANRFPRKVDTTIDEVRTPARPARRAGEVIGPSTIHKTYPEGQHDLVTGRHIPMAEVAARAEAWQREHPKPQTGSETERKRRLALPATERTPMRPDETHAEWSRREERERHELMYGGRP